MTGKQLQERLATCTSESDVVAATLRQLRMRNGPDTRLASANFFYAGVCTAESSEQVGCGANIDCGQGEVCVDRACVPG